MERCPDVLLGRTREMLQAEYATLWLPAQGRYPEMLLSARVDSTGLLDVSNTPPALRQAAMAQRSTLFAGPKAGIETYRAALREANIKDAIIVPLRSGQATIGSLEVTGRLGDLSQFGRSDVRLLETLAAQAAVAVENSRLVDRLRFDAYHDALTGLPNRRRVLALLEEAVKVRAPGEVVAVLLLDIDGLRDVNDSLGHDAGDRMIVEVASRLAAAGPGRGPGRAGRQRRVRGHPASARRRPGGRARRRAPRRAAGADAGRLHHPRRGRRRWRGGSSRPRHEAEALLKAADLAVQAAKQFATPVHLYQPSLRSRSTHRLGLAADMRRALESAEVEVYFQPKVALPDRRVVGVECLARWEHPAHGQVAPADFVAIAEPHRAAGPPHRGRAARGPAPRPRLAGRRAAAAGRGEPQRPYADRPDVPADRVPLLREYDVPSSLLTLEITEDGMVGEPDRPMTTLRRLNEMGVRLAVDDFGTGYSSLSYLRRLPVDEVKIDRSFVQGMATDTGDLAIVRAVVDLARHFGLLVVAEGVESERTVSLLEGLGCDIGQGFLFSRPLPYERFEAWLAVQTEPVDGPASAGAHTGRNARGGAAAARRAIGGISISRGREAPCTLTRAFDAPLAQSAERLHGKEKVYGSIP